MSNPCESDSISRSPPTSDTPCLNHALKIHTKYVDLLDDWEGQKGIFEGGQDALQLWNLMSNVVSTSKEHDWGEDGQLSTLPSAEDLEDAVGADYKIIRAEINAFNAERERLVRQMAEIFVSEQLQSELRSKPYHVRIRLTADLLDRIDLFEDGEHLINTLLINDTAFQVDECLDLGNQTPADAAEYLYMDDSSLRGTFKLAEAGSSEAALQAIGGTIDYLKGISTTLLKEYSSEGNIEKLTKPLGFVLSRFGETKPAGKQLLDNPSKSTLADVRSQFDKDTARSIRLQLQGTTGNVLLVADQLYAIVKLVDLFVNGKPASSAQSLLSFASQAMQVLVGIVETAYQVSKATMKKGLEQALRVLGGIANLASAVVGFVDAEKAYSQGNTWVGRGYRVSAAAAGLLGLLDLAVVTGLVSSSVAGPIGLLLGFVAFIGVMMVIFLADHRIETWFETCAFGKLWNEDPDLFTDPSSLQFRWKLNGKPHYRRQSADLLWMLRGLSLEEQYVIGDSSHLEGQVSREELNTANSRLNISTSDEKHYDYSVLEITGPTFGNDLWVFVKTITKRQNSAAWDITPAYCIDVDREAVHPLISQVEKVEMATGTYDHLTEPNVEKVVIWLASRHFSEIYGINKNTISNDAYLEFDFTVLPPKTSARDAFLYADDLEYQQIPRGRAKLVTS